MNIVKQLDPRDFYVKSISESNLEVWGTYYHGGIDSTVHVQVNKGLKSLDEANEWIDKELSSQYADEMRA